MAFRHSCLSWKELTCGLGEKCFISLRSQNLHKVPFSFFTNHVKTLPTLFWRGYNKTTRAEILADASSYKRPGYQRTTCDGTKSVFFRTVTSSQSKHILGDKLKSVNVVPSYLNHTFCNSSHRRLLLPSHQWNKHVTRNFAVCTKEAKKEIIHQFLYVIPQIFCKRMKHSIPKVPPARIMRLYDFERTIPDEEAAKEFVFALNANERKCLYEELARYHGDYATISSANEPPTRQQLKQVALHQALPFIGFGFLDNLLMIVAGEYIDVTLGATLGISTMAAAALGNMISDVGGLGSAHYVETFASKVGVKNPHLSPVQVDMSSTKWASNTGKVIGVTLGCLLGMFPLLFFDDDKDDKEKKNKAEDKPKDEKN